MSNIYLKSANNLNYNTYNTGYCYILQLGDNDDASGLRYSRQAFFGKGLEVADNYPNYFYIEPRNKEFFVYGILGFDPNTNKNFILVFDNNGNFTRQNIDSRIYEFYAPICFKTNDNHIVGFNFDINIGTGEYNKYTTNADICIEYNSSTLGMEYKANGQTFDCADFPSYTNLTFRYGDTSTSSQNPNQIRYGIRGSSLLQAHYNQASGRRYYLPRYEDSEIFKESSNYIKKYNFIYYTASTVPSSGRGGIATSSSNAFSSSMVNSPSSSGYRPNRMYITNFTKSFTGMVGTNNYPSIDFRSEGIYLRGSSTRIFQYGSNTQFVAVPLRLAANHRMFTTLGGKLIYVSDTDNSNFIGGQVGQIQFDLNDIQLEAGDTFNYLSVLFNSYGQTLAAGTLRYSLNNGSSWNTTTLSQSTTISLSGMDFTQANTIKLQILLTAGTSAYNFNEFEVILY